MRISRAIPSGGGSKANGSGNTSGRPLKLARLPLPPAKSLRGSKGYTGATGRLALRGDVPSPAEAAGSTGNKSTSAASAMIPDGATEVRRFSFESDIDDRDFDAQPDGWLRRQGPTFPHYVDIAIDRTQAAHGKNSLRIRLNGGQAAYYSSSLPVDSSHIYLVRARVRCVGLENDAVAISASLVDETRERKRRWLSRPIAGTHSDWVSVAIVDPIVPNDDERHLILGCHVLVGEKPDVRGVAWIDDLWVGSVPRIELQTDQRSSLFLPDQSPKIRLMLMGLATERDHVIKMVLHDISGIERAKKEFSIAGGNASSANVGNSAAKQTPGYSENAATPVILETDEASLATGTGRRGGLSRDGGVNGGGVNSDRVGVPIPGDEPTFIDAPKAELAEIEKPGDDPGSSSAAGGSPTNQSTSNVAENAGANGSTGITAAKRTDRVAAAAANPLATSPSTLQRGGAMHSLEWTIPSQPTGWYQVTASVEQEGREIHERTLAFVVVPQEAWSSKGEFGWSCETFPEEIAHREFVRLLTSAGNQWVKIPVWTRSQQRDTAEALRLSQLLDDFERNEVQVVGMLSDPPPSLLAKYAQRSVLSSQILCMPRDFWYPSLEPTIATYSFRIRHWQISRDSDESFSTLARLAGTFAAVRQEFTNLGRDPLLGMTWPWSKMFPESGTIEHAFLSLPSSAPMLPSDLKTRLDDTLASGFPRWVLLKPMAVDAAPLAQRGADLARRIVAAKLGKADAVFAADPLSPETGLLFADGTPQELYMTWRTFAGGISGAKYLGRLELPNSSENAVFDRNGELVVVLWNSYAVQEELFLGGDCRQIDLWGREQFLEADEDGSQQIMVGPEPIILRGGSVNVMKWILGVRFEKGRLRSEARAHDEAVLLTNPFPQGVSAELEIKLPEYWSMDPGEWRRSLTAGEAVRLPTVVKFPNDASLGKFRIELMFKIAADRFHRFRVLLPYELGYDDIDLSVSQRWISDTRLEIEQNITNNISPEEELDFDCSLFIPQQIRQRQTVTRLRTGRDKRYYVVENADQLLGKNLWLRAEQTNGRRVLNLHFPIVPAGEASAQIVPKTGAAIPARPGEKSTTR